MDEPALKALHEGFEAAASFDAAQAQAGAAMLAEVEGSGIAAADAEAMLMDGVDGALAVTGQAFPGWALSFDGHASTQKNTIWRCTLKETRGQDDDQIVGIGNARSMRLALMAAVAHIQMMRKAGYR
ncbi:MAG: hypothetical protein JJ920_02040 [Roseitalea sp.]|jgi:hypothetical protein|nr:hypothetical protein [Roseitalea sp.]MBO6721731.1 hypothetical protein [Roseitalea sp.]MBO6741661.1 hypothetical protein [Roseitalea sp.]